MEPSSRDDFVIAIRSAFLKKDTKQKFSLLALILLTLTILIFARYDFRFVKFAKTSLNEIAYRSTFIFSDPENFVKTTYIETKNNLIVYNKNKTLEEKVKELNSKILETNYIISENERLKKTIDDISYLSNEILAKVIVDKQSPFLKSIILNKGSKHGAKLGMAVLDEKYLLDWS